MEDRQSTKYCGGLPRIIVVRIRVVYSCLSQPKKTPDCLAESDRNMLKERKPSTGDGTMEISSL